MPAQRVLQHFLIIDLGAGRPQRGGNSRALKQVLRMTFHMFLPGELCAFIGLAGGYSQLITAITTECEEKGGPLGI